MCWCCVSGCDVSRSTGYHNNGMMASVRRGRGRPANVAQASDRESLSVLQFLKQECGDDLRALVIHNGTQKGLQGNEIVMGTTKSICGKDPTKEVLRVREQDVRDAQGVATKDRYTPAVVRKSFKDLLYQEEYDYNSQSKTNNTNQYYDKQAHGLCNTFPSWRQESEVFDDIWSSHGDNYDCSPTADTTAADDVAYSTDDGAATAADVAAPAADVAAPAAYTTTAAAHINPYITHNTCRPQVFHTSDYSQFNADSQLQLIQNDFEADYLSKKKVSTQLSSSTLQHTKNNGFSGIDKGRSESVSAGPEHNVVKTKAMLIQTIEEKRETIYTKDRYRNYFSKIHKFHYDDKHGSSIIPVDNQYFEYNDVFRDKNEMIKYKNTQIIASELSNNYVCSTENNKDSINNNETIFSRQRFSIKNPDPDECDIDDQNSFILKPESLLSFEDLSEIIKEEVIKDVSEDEMCSTSLIENKTNKKCNSKKNKKHNNNPEVITLCDSTNDTLSHENFESINYVCNVCGYKCKHKDIFTNHMLSHNSPPSKQYRKERLLHECPVCGYKCRHKSIFINHMASHKVTESYLKFGCKLCNFRCNFRRSLRQHSINHETKKMLSCTECDYTNTSANQYHEHVTNTGHKVFRCSVCKEKFNCHKEFSEHKQIHPSRKCPECGKLFNSKFRLQRHLQYESEDNKFECKYCKETFKTNCILRVHVLNHKSRPFHCSLCTKKFTRIDNLRSHMSSHNGQKPFSCSVCDKKYTKKAYLRRHLLDHNH